MIEKILCATDGSHSARKAVDFAAPLGAACGVHVAFVVVNTVTEEKLRTTVGWNSEELRVAQAQIRGELDHAREVAEKAGTDFSLHEAEGRNVAETIVAFARSEGCNHIVVGSAGRSGLVGALIGSVARGVVIQAACPVTVMR
ncbi:MAG TPA: universal stress protein [Rubrobacter sp.]|jgi:nucleotide-binding universal stress UspA family protein|nr:universal stress protein [Rubrobacter sp.]